MPMSDKAREALSKIKGDDRVSYAAHADTIAGARRSVVDIESALPELQWSLDEVDDPTDRAVGIEEESQKLAGLRENLGHLKKWLRRTEESLREIDRETPKIEARLEAHEPTNEG